MKDILNLSLSEFAGRTFFGEIFEQDLVVAQITGNRPMLNDRTLFPLRLQAHSVVLVCSGQMTIDLDYQSYKVGQDMVLEVTAEDIVENIALSSDFFGFHIIISLEMMIDILRGVTPAPLPDVGHLKRLHPMRQLTARQMERQVGSVERIRNHMADSTHIFRTQIIKNELSTFLLELNNELLQSFADHTKEQTQVNETLAFRFISLLIKNCREQHRVSFYADALCVTPDHLSRTMNASSGRSASSWINHALIVEAKFLLHKSDFNAQQVAEILNFADQSTFSKFFKRQTGLSPSAYVRNL